MPDKPAHVTCAQCKTTAPIPEGRDHRGLWENGWRWNGPALASCPACPPVIVDDEDRRHHLGPGATAAPVTML
ncbi:hypothetical protein [Streptomyces fractus]|uniref:hypothetical protein n=1 Tax=Streptomyces fractus TaxID=641806 RepID=UPI003CF0FF22